MSTLRSLIDRFRHAPPTSREERERVRESGGSSVDGLRASGDKETWWKRTSLDEGEADFSKTEAVITQAIQTAMEKIVPPALARGGLSPVQTEGSSSSQLNPPPSAVPLSITADTLPRSSEGGLAGTTAADGTSTSGSVHSSSSTGGAPSSTASAAVVAAKDPSP
jgi:hypothetical protein